MPGTSFHGRSSLMSGSAVSTHMQASAVPACMLRLRLQACSCGIATLEMLKHVTRLLHQVTPYRSNVRRANRQPRHANDVYSLHQITERMSTGLILCSLQHACNIKPVGLQASGILWHSVPLSTYTDGYILCCLQLPSDEDPHGCACEAITQIFWVLAKQHS